MTYDDDKLSSPHEGETCPECGCGLEVDDFTRRLYCPECEMETNDEH